MKLRQSWAIVFVAALLSACGPAANSGTTATELKNLMNQNLNACQAEDLVAMMNTFHTQSPSYLLSKQQTPMLFANFDLNNELLSFTYIGQDEDYAYARISQKTTKIAGPAFRNNEVGQLAVFRKENGQWKLWTQAILDLKYLE